MYRPGLSIIIPTYNESKSIADLVKRIAWTMVEANTNYEIIVVDDHSNDQTREIVSALAKYYPITFSLKDGPRGMGYSILQAVPDAMYEYLAILDADGCYDPQILPQLLERAISHGFAVARRSGYQTGLFQKFVGRILLGLKEDTYSGLKVFKKEIFSHLDSGLVSAWVIDAPLVYTALEHGYPGSYIDIKYTPRNRNKSLSHLFTQFYSRLKGTIKTRLSRAPYHQIVEDSPLGSGVIFKRHKFITHSLLPLDLSALRTFSPWQLIFILSCFLIFATGIVNNTTITLIALTSILSFIYLVDVIFNLFVTLKSLHFPPEISSSLKELKSLKASDLPMYTVLCPLYKEARVLPDFVSSMTALDYPKSKLEIFLLLEEDDTLTIEAAKSMALPSYFHIMVVPQSSPKTKPKACNYGLAHAKGEYIVIYDAEDQPEPLQLKKAYLALKNGNDTIGCVQAKLNYFNPTHNLLTRLFTAEYSLWFDVILPGLQSIRTTIPLGGTSNHFKTKLLKDLSGWDPFNVTEDADLGTRLFNAGYQTAIIDSTTLEEANSNLRNWFRQRSRWLKGYMQTYLVHMRNPLALFKAQGVHAILFNLIVGGKIAFILINPFLWVMTISYFLLYAYVGPAIESIYPPLVFYMALTSLVLGNFIALYNYMIGCAKRGHYELIKYVFLIPLYWLAISYAAAVALVQLFLKPHYWEKTIHGLHLDHADKKTASELAKSARGLKYQQYADIASNVWNAGGVMVVATLFANIMNFLYNAYLGRHLSLEDFGEISLFGSFMYIASVPLAALSRSVTHASGYLLGKYGVPIKAIWLNLKNRSLFISFLVSMLWLAIIPLMQQFFKVESILPFVLFAPVWIIATFNSLNGGFLSGNLIFWVTALTAILESLSKFALTAGFVSIDLKHFVYASTPLSLLFVMFIEWWAIHRLKESKVSTKIKAKDLSISKKFYFTSILNSLTKVTYLSLDLILAKHFLSPVEAGAYSYLSLAGKMVFFLSSMFSQFLVPYVAKDMGENKHPYKTFIRLFGLVSLANISAVIVFGFLGFITAPLLWGDKATQIIMYLPIYSVAMAFFSMTAMIINYQQIRLRYIFPIVGFGLGTLQVLGLLLGQHTISGLVWVVFTTAIVSLALILLLSKYYGAVVDLYHALIDFIGLFKPIPRIEKLPNGKLRILIFNWRDLRHKWAGGAEVYLHELSKRWVSMGHEVTIFAGNDGNSSRFEKLDGVRLVRRGGFYLVYIWAFLYYFFRLRGRYDVIIDSENGLPFFTPLYVSEPVFLLIHHVHQEVFRKSLIPPFSWLALFLERRVMPLVYRNTKLITVSPSSKADILLHKLTTKDPHIIYNGVDLKKCVPGIKSKHPSVLYLGRLTTAKSVHVLINAATILIKKIPNIQITIAGDGPAIKSLKRLTSKLKLDNLILFTGKVSEEEKIKLYQSSWVFVNPSLIEGWGITTIEANACGTPVVASNVAGLRDAVNNPHSGYLVPYGNVEEFANNIESLIKDRKTRTRMSQESVDWAAKFDWDKSASEAINIISSNQLTINPEYSWLKSFESPSYPNSLKLGTAIYKGRKIFVKEWTSPPKSAYNEVSTYELLVNQLNGKVQIPKHIFTIKSSGKLVLGIEYVDGKLLSSLTPSRQLKSYESILKELAKVRVSTGSGIGKRDYSFIVSTFPYILVKALFTHPNLAKNIINGSKMFIKNLKYLKNTKLTFLHRDLGLDNIMISKGTIYILDFQFATMGPKEYEFSGIYRSLSRNKSLSTTFLGYLKSTHLRDFGSKSRFILLSSYYTLLGLTDKNYAAKRVKNFIYILSKLQTL